MMTHGPVSRVSRCGLTSNLVTGTGADREITTHYQHLTHTG